MDTIGQGARERRRDHYWLGRADGVIEPSALLDAAGWIVRSNAAMDQLLAGGSGLALAAPTGRSRLVAVDAAQQPGIDAAIARATLPVAPTPAAVRYRRPGGGAALILAIHPTPWTTRLRHLVDVAALLTIVDPARRPPRPIELWREAFDLTPAETELAMLLMAGHSVESAAANRDCRPATLRVHLRHLFAKTGVSRQTDLLALLGRFG